MWSGQIAALSPAGVQRAIARVTPFNYYYHYYNNYRYNTILYRRTIILYYFCDYIILLYSLIQYTIIDQWFPTRLVPRSTIANV